MEQNGWEALKTKMVFCVGIKTKELLEWFYGKCLYGLRFWISWNNYVNL
jgi:uroporphyrinogen-III synthase